MKYLIGAAFLVIYALFAMLIGSFIRAGNGPERQAEPIKDNRPKLRIV